MTQNTIRCWLHYSDGVYGLTVAEGPLVNHGNVDVPADLVRRHQALNEQWLSVQRELLAIDNDLYDAEESARVSSKESSDPKSDTGN